MNVNAALGVSKPVWLRALGWISFVGFLVAPALALTETVSHYRIPRTVWPGYALFVAFLCLPVWMLGTVIYKMQRSQAKLTAAEIIRAAQRAAPQPAVPPKVHDAKS